VAQRTAVRAIQATFRLSERRACGLVGLGRSTCRYQTRRGGWPALRERLHALAAERRRFGYRRLYVLLRREGYRVNREPDSHFLTGAKSGSRSNGIVIF
jgi:putative transposase